MGKKYTLSHEKDFKAPKKKENGDNSQGKAEDVAANVEMKEYDGKRNGARAQSANNGATPGSGENIQNQTAGKELGPTRSSSISSGDAKSISNISTGGEEGSGTTGSTGESSVKSARKTSPSPSSSSAVAVITPGDVGYVNPAFDEGPPPPAYGDVGGDLGDGAGRLVVISHQGGTPISPVKDKQKDVDESVYTISDAEEENDGEVSLLYSRHEKIPMKDFAAEIRASLDVENFLNSAILLLNLDEASIDAILDRMLRPLIVDNDEPVTMAEAKRAIFTHDSVHKLAKTIQGTCCTYSGAFDYDQSWLCILCTMPALQRRHVAIARLRTPANLGRTSQEVYFIILVVAPTKEKGTKNALETGRTFATLFADIDLRQQLLCVNSHDEFKKLLWEHTKELAEEQSHPERKLSGGDQAMIDEDKTRCWFARGLRQDFKRRLPHYVSDFKDGFVGPHTIHKTLATTIFLYFACLLPSIAFGMLNDTNTKGKMDVKKVIYSQTMGGLIFAFVGGQPLVVLLTTAPLALYTKVIYNICDDWGLDFFAMYACVGLWNMMFLLLYAVSDASRLMKWSTRSTEEIFALFISIAFIVDAFRDVYHNFAENYNSKACSDTNHQPASSTLLNGSAAQVLATTVSSIANDTNSSAVGAAAGVAEVCLRENSLLYLLLCLGTLWLGISLFNFTKTPYLNASKREILADYALPFAVIIMSFFGSYVFRGVKLQPFNFYDGAVFNLPPLGRLPWGGVLGAMALGFPLSLLFFMDQNISSAMVNSPANKLKKGSAYHWDMMIIAILNGVLSFYGLPMVHGALPHSPLHVRALADVEDYVEQGHVYQKIVRVRETRVTAVTAHILIGLSLLMLPNPLSYIPRAVLDGLFLYLAINALNHNQMFDRILLLATEQAAYPPNHYIRSVPQRKVHMFTGAQILQLAVMCGFGFSPYPYLKMTFPVIILLLLPIRHKVVPRVIEKKYLEYLDG